MKNIFKLAHKYTAHEMDTAKCLASSVGTQTLHVDVQAILDRPRIKQHTEDWYNNRKLLLTASDAASALGQGFKSRNALFKIKTGQTKKEEGLNMACRYGLEQEESAGQAYTGATGIELVEEDIGLLVHPTNLKFGASPDRIAKYSPIIVEIKAPWRRKIASAAPADTGR